MQTMTRDRRGLSRFYRLSSSLEITPAELDRRRREGPAIVLLDCREPEELECARLEPCVHIPLRQIESRIEEIRSMAAERDVAIICHHGRRSLIATRLLRAAGIANVWSVAGGLEAWSRGIDPSVPEYTRHR